MVEEFPAGLKYNRDYSWVRKEGNLAEVGVISSAAKKVKEFVFIKLPKTGAAIKKGETYASLEAVKWSGHLGSPVSGEVVEVNDSLFDEPSKINRDPYGSWIMKVRMSSPEELDGLMGPEEASEWAKKKME